MIRQVLAQLGVIRAVAFLGVIVLAAIAGYWWHINALFPGTGHEIGMLTIYLPCDADVTMVPEDVVLLGKPYVLTLNASYYDYDVGPPHCHFIATASAPQFDIIPNEMQSVNLADGEMADVSWTLIPRQPGMHTVTVYWPQAKENSARYLEWHVGVIDSAFERMVGLTPGQIQKIGGVLGIGLLLPYVIVSLYRILRRQPAFSNRHHSPE